MGGLTLDFRLTLPVVSLSSYSIWATTAAAATDTAAAAADGYR